MSAHDISRYLFQPEKRYVGTRMQQGRVITDEDLNAHRRLDAEDARRILAEVICSKGSPNGGFLIRDVQVVDEETGAYDGAITAGSFYLGGLRFEAGENERLLAQPDFLQIDAADGGLPTRPADERAQLVYLRGWEQEVSAVEDREILEHALGGPDTSVFVRRTRRVGVFTLPEGFRGGCAEAFAALVASLTQDENGNAIATVDAGSGELRSTTRLTVGFREEPTEDPCQPSVSAGYIGADNQAIRVQLTAPDRFVWGYDNASPLYRVQVRDVEGAADGERRRVRFLTLPRDELAQPTTAHVVEVLRWGALLPNDEKAAERALESHFTRVETSFDPETNDLVIADAVPEAWMDWLDDHPELRSERDDGDEAAYFYLRVWTGGPPAEGDQPDHAFDPAGDPAPLPGTGLTLTFSQRGRRNDHWIIAARPNTPDQVVPWTLLESEPPAGPRHYLAPLALVEWTRAADQSLVPGLHDCRHRFRPLCDSTGCCTVTVGDGTTSTGVFASIQQAVDFLPAEGGEICLLPGLHAGNVTVAGRRDIRIHGCGKQTIVVPGPTARDVPVFTITDSTGIVVEHCTVVSLDGIAVRLGQSEGSELSEIRLAHNRIVALEHAVQVRGGRRLDISWNRMRVLDREGGLEAILCLATDSRIERNDVGVKPAPPEEPRDPETPPRDPDPEDPCADREILYVNLAALLGKITPLLAYFVPGFLTLLPGVRPYRALGGIRIAAGSEDVRILENTITGGAGNGITLGGAPPAAPVDEPPEEAPAVRLRNDADRIHARLVGAPADVSGVAVRFTEAGGLRRVVSAVSDPTGRVVGVAEPAEYEVTVISPESRAVNVTTRDQGEFGVVHEIAVERVTAPPRAPALGFLYDVAIEHNEITAMGLSGVGSPLSSDAPVTLVPAVNRIAAFRALNPSTPVGNPVLGARIVENVIRGNLRNPFDDELRRVSESRGLGGISLDFASGIEIGENAIEDNGRNHLDPACGIFVGVGDQLEIHRNQVVDNGAIDTSSSLEPRQGVRGGIVIGASLQLFPAALRLGFFRDYAARIHDNLCRQPVGHALLAAGVGPMSVDANRLHTTRSAPGSLGALAGTVVLVNRGNARGASGATTFHGNQVRGGTEVRSLLNAVLVTGDDLGLDANQIDAGFRGLSTSVGALTFSLLYNAILVGSTLRASDSRFTEPDSRVSPDLGVVDVAVSLLSLATTMNNTVSNQGDHCIFATSAAGASRVRNQLNQVLDNRLCQTTGGAIAVPAQNYTLSRSAEATLGTAAAFGTATSVAEVSETQLIAARTTEMFTTLDAAETALAGTLLQTEVEARALVQHEAARVASQAGDDARLAEFRAHLDTRLATARTLAVEADVAAVTIDPVEAEGMRIHGRVADAAGTGISGLLVCVLDAEGAAVDGVDRRTTDTSGYYGFVLDAETVKALVETQPDGVHVGFFTRRGTPVFTAREAITPAAGTTEVVNLHLDRDTFEVLDPVKPGPGPEPQLIDVPAVVGLAHDEAQAALKEAGLTVGTVTTEVDATQEPGTVLRQIPEAGARVAPGLPVDLVLAVGEAAVTVPELVGRSLRQARNLLLEADLQVGTVEPSDADDDSLVVGQSPEPGTSVGPGTQVNLKVEPPGDEPVEVEVPDLRGLTPDDARRTLVRAKLVVGQTSSRPTSPDLVGLVVAQAPQAGTRVLPETSISIVVGTARGDGPPTDSRPADVTIARMASGRTFESVGASEAKLVRLAGEHGLDTGSELATLLERDDRDVRDLFRLPNLDAAAAFKRLLKSALEARE